MKTRYHLLVLLLVASLLSATAQALSPAAPAASARQADTDLAAKRTQAEQLAKDGKVKEAEAEWRAVLKVQARVPWCAAGASAMMKTSHCMISDERKAGHLEEWRTEAVGFGLELGMMPESLSSCLH